MRKCKLSDCVKEINDRTTENNQHEVLTSSKSGIFSQEEYFDKQVASKDNTGYKIIRRGQFTYRSMSDSGTFTINRLENKEIGIVSPAYPVFEAKNIDAEFLKYYFKSELFNKAIINLSQGSTRTALKFKDLVDIEIYLPEIEEQKKIVKILKNNDHVIEKYNELIKEKEQFIKSQFVEMFKDCTKKNLEEVAEIIMGQSPDSKSYNDLENGIPFLQGKGDYGKKYTRISHWTTEPSKIAEKGNILMSVRAPVGDVNIASERCCIGRGLCSINAKKNIMNNDFIFNALIATKDKIEAKGAGSTFNAITKKDVYEIQIPVATIELQNQFAEIVRLIDKQKFNYINKIKLLNEIINIFLGGKKI